jgi:hypothetical protein
VIPIDEVQFAEIFTAWLTRNYGIENVEKLTTTTPDKLKYRTPSRNTRTTSY